MAVPDQIDRTRHNFKPSKAARPLDRVRQIFPRRMLVAALLGLALAANLRADTISGTVKDPSGAVVVNARIEITGNAISQPVILLSDESGRFSAPHLGAGKYSVRVAKEGFAELITPVDLQDVANLDLTLTIAAQQTSVNVTEKSTGLGNSDPVYRQLREAGLGDTYRCEKFTLSLDVGTFQLDSGTITLLKAVNNFQTGAIFVGQGHFTLKPLNHVDTQEMIRRSGKPIAEEDLSEVVFRFTPGLYPKVAVAFGPRVETPHAAADALQHWQNKVRHRHEFPEGFTQEIFEQESIDNVDADVLAAIYNPKHPPFFNAYMVGAPHKDLRFFVRSRVGAIPQMDSPEEVALINFSGAGMDDGVWYSEHLAAELKAQTADSREDRRLFATHRYHIETVIGKNNHLYSRATITFRPLVSGERVLKFALLPTLRVTRVSDENGKELHFIQESKKEDGSFYAVLDQAPEIAKEHLISVEYVGDKVLYDAGSGSYYVGARESWYPNLNGFGEKALYDLTFKVPRSNVVISVGQLVGESTEAGFAVTHWVTPVAVAIAGFNYGRYTKIELPDPITHYHISGYYLSELPSNLKQFAGTLSGNAPASNMQANALSAMSPMAMTKYALDQARAQMQVCTLYFGRAPYENIEITEQPNFSFGQSWPNLVYLPISAYLDSTQRWMLFGQINAKFSGFVQEVTPHEVAHQWFGHSVGWASYHDQWLSEGFAEFAAGLFLQQAVGPKWQKDYLDFWERQRVRILEKNNFGVSPNDAGPLWLGRRLDSPRSERAYAGLTYPKGAYVLQMLRSLMYADQAAEGNRDQAFIDMMHDFMESHHDSNASTESFKAVAEKHMPKKLDLQQNGRLDWFFDEWVYGTQVPRYQFKYDLQQGDKGQVKVHVEITQSEVDRNFAMLVPVFADFGQGWVRLGQLALAGNSTRSAIFHMDRQPKKVALNVYKDVLER